MTAETVQPLRPDSEPAPLPEVLGGFHTSQRDRHRHFTNRTGKVANEKRRLDRYSTMRLAGIKDIEGADGAAKNAHLYRPHDGVFLLTPVFAAAALAFGAPSSCAICRARWYRSRLSGRGRSVWRRRLPRP